MLSCMQSCHVPHRAVCFMCRVGALERAKSLSASGRSSDDANTAYLQALYGGLHAATESWAKDKVRVGKVGEGCG